jgi:hypothetical protein
VVSATSRFLTDTSAADGGGGSRALFDGGHVESAPNTSTRAGLSNHRHPQHWVNARRALPWRIDPVQDLTVLMFSIELTAMNDARRSHRALEPTLARVLRTGAVSARTFHCVSVAALPMSTPTWGMVCSLARIIRRCTARSRDVEHADLALR